MKKLSFLFDVKIFFKTVLSVIKSDGVVEGKTETTTATLTESEN